MFRHAHRFRGKAKDGKLFFPQIGRERYLTHPEVSGLVCAECLMYHNTVWPEGRGPIPPLHVGCNCTRTPEVDLSFHDYAFWTQEAAFDEPDRPNDVLRARLKRMTRYEMDRLFGKTIASMLRAKLVDVGQVVTPTSGLKTLDRVVKETPGLTKQKLKTKTPEELAGSVRRAEKEAAKAKAKARRKAGGRKDGAAAEIPPPQKAPGASIQDQIRNYARGDALVEMAKGLQADYEAVAAEVQRAAEKSIQLGKQWERTFNRLAKAESQLYDAERRGQEIPWLEKQAQEMRDTLAKLQVQHEENEKKRTALENAEKAAKAEARGAVWDAIATRGKTITFSNDIKAQHAELKARVDEVQRWVGKMVTRPDAVPEKRPIAYEIDPEHRRGVHKGRGTHKIGLSELCEDWRIVHEIGHELEDILPGARRAALEFLLHRVGSEIPVRLKDLFPNSTYKDNEYGRKDRFDRFFSEDEAYYCGKDYGPWATEIISMGMQALRKDPIEFAQKDPEFFKFTTGILDGSLR